MRETANDKDVSRYLKNISYPYTFRRCTKIYKKW